MRRAARILIVDDDPGMRQMLEVLLRRAGHALEVCSGGQAALDRLAAPNDFDLVITDLVMPEVGGMQVLSAAKAQGPDCQVIVVTAYATTEAAVEAMRRGAYDYVQKPFANDELRALRREGAREARAPARERRPAGPHRGALPAG